MEEKINRQQLSFKAQAIYFLIGQSIKGDGLGPNPVKFEMIMMQSSDGRDSVRNGIRELESFGLVKMVTEVGSDGLLRHLGYVIAKPNYTLFLWNR
jgi:hypothetical protein